MVKRIKIYTENQQFAIYNTNQYLHHGVVHLYILYMNIYLYTLSYSTFPFFLNFPTVLYRFIGRNGKKCHGNNLTSVAFRRHGDTLLPRHQRLR